MIKAFLYGFWEIDAVISCATLRQFHRLGYLNSKYVCLTVWSVGSSRSGSWTFVLGKDPLSGLWIADISLYPHRIFSFCTYGGREEEGKEEKEGEGEREHENTLVSSFSYKGHYLIMRTPLLMTSSKHNYCSNAPPPNTIILGAMSSRNEIWGNTNDAFLYMFMYTQVDYLKDLIH